MIRALQRRFVTAAMAAITVLILFLLGAINAANLVLVSRQIQGTLQAIALVETGGAGPALPWGAAGGPGRFMEPPKNEYDTVMSSNFAVVRLDGDGNALFTDALRTSSVSDEEARELAELACEGGRESGRIGKFRYLVQSVPGGTDRWVILLDASEERYSCLRMLLLSAAAGLACWGGMLALVILLSRRAIRPIAENMEKQKQFVTNAGHEIKTPLAIIQSNTEAMELYTGETRWSKNIKEQTTRLTGLMKDLLTLARMDEGAGAAVASDFSLSELLEKALREFSQPMEAKEMSLETHIQPEVSLHADPGQVEQLVSILLDNAVKYTGRGGRVLVSLCRTDKRVRLYFQNTCQDLPAVPPERLFDRFYRGDAARTQRSGGYGIGLAMARSIAQANGGTLRAQYIPPDSIGFTAQF